jgi:hypothetical protein
MLWYKAWLDTRSRFWIGLVLLMLSAAGVVVGFPRVQRIGAVDLDPNDPLFQVLSDALELSRTFRGFVWHEWFRQNALTIGALFAALLGTSNMFSSSRRGVLFTLSLPVSRRQWFATRAATGLAELLVLMVMPALVIALLGVATGQPYSIGEGLVYALCGFVGVATFFGLALLLSTIFQDMWRPVVIVCLVAVCLSFLELLVPSGFGIFSTLSAEQYFRGGSLPWAGLGLFVLAAAGLLYAAAHQVERLDF